MEKKTPLYAFHVSAGARMTDFAGYSMPIQYTDILEEHMAVRTAAGLFDVSHMGEVTVRGAGALAYLNHLLTNDFTSMTNGRCRYSPMCNPDGGVIDDLLIYRLGPENYLAVVNASNREKDYEWMKKNLTGEAELADISDSVAQIALQGPKSLAILSRLTDPLCLPVKYYTFTEHCAVSGVDCLISRTGYTGEDGFELYCGADDAEKLWNALLTAGKGDGLIPCGLGARDTLRMEAAMPLYGHEMDDEISPLETDLDFAVKMGKPDFIGKSALEARGEPKITRVGLKTTGRGIIREHCDVWLGDRRIGRTTSGTYLPYLKGSYAMALVEKEHGTVGTAVSADVRGRRVEAEIVPLPFYKRK